MGFVLVGSTQQQGDVVNKAFGGAVGARESITTANGFSYSLDTSKKAGSMDISWQVEYEVLVKKTF